MRIVFLILSATLILCPNSGTRAQESASSGPSLVLVKGDNPSSPTSSCSFISVTELRPVPIVQGLLLILPGDLPAAVEAKVGSPDQPYANDILQWTGMQGGNYVKAVVKFRNNGALTSSFTMATNYQQPDQKQCQWEVREEQQEIEQNPPSRPSIPNNLTNQVKPTRSGTTQNGKLIGGDVSYPRGSRINADGIISTPRGQRTLPSVSIPHGNGSTSYYYRDGAHITIQRTTISPNGTPIR